jgi:hypothetical protein
MKRFLKCYIRDWLGFCTVTQIFLSDSFNISNFKHNVDTEDFAKDLLSRQLFPLIIDCGGNIGLGTKYFLGASPDSVVACIEPENRNLAQARLNSQDSRVTFVEAAIGPCKAEANIFDPQIGMTLTKFN